MKYRLFISITVLYFCSIVSGLKAQTTITGVVRDAETKEILISANVQVEGSQHGTFTDLEGQFQLSVKTLPATLIFSYLGYKNQRVTVEGKEDIIVEMESETGIQLGTVQVRGQRISEKQKLAPLTVESMDLRAIKETASDNFYDGLGNLKGVDITAASLGFKVINTRGFNSTSPVRSLQIIDGVDNQSPGLNFSLGNFLGSPELDVLKVDIIQGASSAFYGPNAFNGVISIETKNPFYHKGLSASLKIGEQSMVEGALRWAGVFKSKDQVERLGFKVNFAFLDANDWVANNYDPIDDSRVPINNPGGYDAVNIYGDEYSASGDFSSVPPWQFQGLGQFYRTGYREVDLVDYRTHNLKANVGFYWRLKPSAKELSPELVFSSSYAKGSTIYQGDNRFALKDIQFFQHKIEWRQKDVYFLRAYMTHENAGKSYDPYFTALRILEETRATTSWNTSYQNFWSNNIIQDSVIAMGYPRLTPMVDDVGNITFEFDEAKAEQWLIDHNEDLGRWHQLARKHADEKRDGGFGLPYAPAGSEEFKSLFQKIISQKRKEGGTLFVDRSQLIHLHGEYTFSDVLGLDEWKLGGNGRFYRPNSEGTIFSDTVSRIQNSEFGLYTGISHRIWQNKFKVSASLRLDKNENFSPILSPAASIVYIPSAHNYLRVSFSSAIRNPTLSDQYLYLDVGPALLLGNLNGANNLVDIASLKLFFENSQNANYLEYFDIDPIQPEKVKTIEVGYRTTLWSSLYMDLGYYFSSYVDFIGYNIGGELTYNKQTGLLQSVNIYRYAANSKNEVQTQGASMGLNYYFPVHFGLSGNYSWNTIVKTVADDPIIPAFNTPEHKFNLGLSGRDFKFGNSQAIWGFRINYKWIQGFVFEGSPQFTGKVPTYDLLDGQINCGLPSLSSTIKVGVSNALNKKNFQTYGGPRVGRLAYISIVYDFKK